jgi:hypothetical protein
MICRLYVQELEVDHVTWRCGARAQANQQHLFWALLYRRC